MSEQKITIIIDENGKIDAKTDGIKGEMCLNELSGLLAMETELMKISKTDDFYQTNELHTKRTVKREQK
ncbi:hypothetical protein QJU89_02435 [Pasteurella skyensis]|uniref:DUF2997 domain-containing protein n=1 Tax=Phocoenobacter skyensis TaxID=97481 RepID=A0AAJ6N8S2_9PAST|nr:hypothetical protein [Pasteurella skyensis]MDP8162368.1 hypothetical protein [Pasteurella skyensis]MDP8172298.1 hypothetical protein [Pasteurella skyensis]MDP8178553.1 hypothetical protein [Pasteurella skyensis]MDP8182555.1 hypothetical protein [Pasteurella skyensis]MDP8188860.1 hypothetical protein [Pasteurella skyensis]